MEKMRKRYPPSFKARVALEAIKEQKTSAEKEIFSEAIRRFLDTHQSKLMDKFIRDNVKWGLLGNE